MAHATFVELDAERRAFLALPDSNGPHPAVVVNMEAFGLNDYIQSECLRLAEAGYAAIAPDYYEGKLYDYTDSETVYAKLRANGDAFLMGYVRAAVGYLDAHPTVRSGPYGVLGFCMGGRLSLLTGAEIPTKIGAVAAFYPGGVAPDEPSFGRPILLERLAEIAAPILVHYGADDESIAPAERTRLTAKLCETKQRFTLSVYPGAGHGSASRDRPSFSPVATDEAWDESLRFLGRHLR